MVHPTQPESVGVSSDAHAVVDRSAFAADGQDKTAEQSPRMLGSDGATISRIDAAHALGPSSTSPRDSTPPPATDEDDATDFDEQTNLLIQASRIAQTMRDRSAEMKTRERELTVLQQQLATAASDVQEQEAELQARNSDLARRIATFTERRQELETRFTELDDAFAKLEDERSRIREAVLADLRAERDELERERSDIQAEASRLTREHEDALRDVNETIEAERRSMREQVDSEMKRRAAELQQERLSWEADWTKELARVDEYRMNAESEIEAVRAKLAEQQQAADAERQQFEQARRDFTAAQQAFHAEQQIVGGIEAREQAVTRAEANLEAEYERIRERVSAELERDTAALQRERQEFETTRAEHAQDLKTREAQVIERTQQLEQLGEELQQVKQELDAGSNELEDRIRRSRDEIENERQEVLTELDVKRQGLRNELDTEKLAHDQKLLEERRDFDSERDTLRLQMQQQENVLRNRFRFQQEHLQNTRQELEQAQRNQRRDVQLQRAEAAEQAELLRLLRRNLDQYRALLEEREASIGRERALIAKSGKSKAVEMERDRTSLQAERNAWVHECDAQKSEIRRQQDMLSAHAENLEMRRKRLDDLRSELETTHRTTLETRMAVEEAWAQLTQATDPETARDRVESARAALTEHYGHLSEALSLQRHELQDSTSLFQRQKDDFRGERQTLTVWVSERDEKLRMWDERLRTESSSLDEREARWRMARDSWVNERLEAESVIRGLLKQITELTRATGVRDSDLQTEDLPRTSGNSNLAAILDPRD